MARLRVSWRTSLTAPQQARNPQPESIARSPYESPVWAHQRDIGHTPPAVTASAARLDMGRSALVGDQRSDPACGGTARARPPFQPPETPCWWRECLRADVDRLLAK